MKRKQNDAKTFVLNRHVKQLFVSNDKACVYMLNYFQRFLPILIYNYAVHRKQPCVVFDIDDTVLCYTFGSPLIGRELQLTSPNVLALFNLFRNHQVLMFFVTARPYSELNRVLTEQELKTLGFEGYQSIYFMPSFEQDIGLYKYNARQWIAQKHPILFNMGDQWTDLTKETIDDQKKYKDKAVLMYGAEPNCNWALKLTTQKNGRARFKIE